MTEGAAVSCRIRQFLVGGCNWKKEQGVTAVPSFLCSQIGSRREYHDMYSLPAVFLVFNGSECIHQGAKASVPYGSKMTRKIMTLQEIIVLNQVCCLLPMKPTLICSFDLICSSASAASLSEVMVDLAAQRHERRVQQNRRALTLPSPAWLWRAWTWGWITGGHGDHGWEICLLFSGG